MSKDFYANIQSPSLVFLRTLHTNIQEGKGWKEDLSKEVDLILLFTAHHLLQAKFKEFHPYHLQTIEGLGSSSIEFSAEEAKFILRPLFHHNQSGEYTAYLDIVKRKSSEHVRQIICFSCASRSFLVQRGSSLLPRFKQLSRTTFRYHQLHFHPRRR